MSIEHLNQYLVDQNWAKAAQVLAPLARSPQAHPSILYNYGKVLMEMQRLQEASDIFRRCLKQHPDHLNACFELGRCLIELQDYEPALVCFQKVNDLSPDDPDAWRNMGRIAIVLGRWKDAQLAWSRLPQGDLEAQLALYRVSAELQLPDVQERQADLLARHPNRAAVLQTLVRVSKGSLPLTVPVSEVQSS